jgi:transposase
MYTRERGSHRITALLARRPTKLAAIALANKMARMACAMMTTRERYKESVTLAA